MAPKPIHIYCPHVGGVFEDKTLGDTIQIYVRRRIRTDHTPRDGLAAASEDFYQKDATGKTEQIQIQISTDYMMHEQFDELIPAAL